MPPCILNYLDTVTVVNDSYRPEIFNINFIVNNVNCILTNIGKVYFYGVKIFDIFCYEIKRL